MDKFITWCYIIAAILFIFVVAFDSVLCFGISVFLGTLASCFIVAGNDHSEK